MKSIMINNVRKFIFFVFLLVCVCETFAQKIDLGNFDIRLKKIEERDKLLVKNNDSLAKELLFYKVKEDYFAEALGDQANRFALIISGILTFFSIIAGLSIWNVDKRIKKEKTKIKLQIEEQKKDFLEHQKSYNELEDDLRRASINLYALGAKIFFEENKFEDALVFLTESALHANQFSIKDIEKGGNIDFSITLNHLATANECLEKLIPNKLKESEYYTAIIGNLEKLSNSKSLEVKSESIKLKTTIEEKIKNRNEE